MKVTVNSTNGKGIKKLFKRLEKGSVDVGILTGEGKHEDIDLSVAEVGFFNEFGTSSIPERSFIRSTINGKSKEIKKVAAAQYKLVLNGNTSNEKGLGILGAFTAGLIQEAFTSNDWPNNAQSTINIKGSSRPLIDTGQLRQSISWKVNA
jgi:hypothetical protein